MCTHKGVYTVRMYVCTYSIYTVYIAMVHNYMYIMGNVKIEKLGLNYVESSNSFQKY